MAQRGGGGGVSMEIDRVSTEFANCHDKKFQTEKSLLLLRKVRFPGSDVRVVWNNVHRVLHRA